MAGFQILCKIYDKEQCLCNFSLLHVHYGQHGSCILPRHREGVLILSAIYYHVMISCGDRGATTLPWLFIVSTFFWPMKNIYRNLTAFQLMSKRSSKNHISIFFGNVKRARTSINFPIQSPELIVQTVTDWWDVMSFQWRWTSETVRGWAAKGRQL